MGSLLLGSSARIHRCPPAARPHTGTPTALPTLNGQPDRHRGGALSDAPVWCRSRRRTSVDPGLAASDEKRPGLGELVTDNGE